jgi:hypothetical protein
MMKRLSAPLLACALATTAALAGFQAQAQTTAPGSRVVAAAAQKILDSADWKALTDERIDLVKTALQLSPDQAKHWPAIEEAMRARGQMRYDRLNALATPRTERRDIVELMHDRAKVLSQRSAALNKLADAWQPLWPTLSTAQKARLRILAVYTIREMADRVEDRRMQMMDEDDDAED